MGRGFEHDVEVVQLLCHFRDEFGLGQRFAAGECHTAFAGAQQVGLAVDAFGQFRRGKDLARHAFAGRPAEDLARRLAFGIVAPGTPQRTPLQENGDPNAGPVVNREFLDVEYNACQHESKGTAGYWRSHFFQFCSYSLQRSRFVTGGSGE